MTTAIAGGSLAVDFSLIDLNNLFSGTITVANSSLIRVDFGGGTYDDFTGHFIYSGGFLAGGTLTGIQEHIGGILNFTVSNFSMPVATFFDYLDAGDTQGFLADILSGNDSLL